VTAIRHWVLPWRGKAIVAGDPADCSGVEVRSAK
jgi:hypothetical protein